MLDNFSSSAQRAILLAESYAQVVLNTEILGGAKYLTNEQEKEILELRKKL